MNLQEHIRKILKEETTLQKNLIGLFKNQGVEVATAAVGGFDNFAKILNLNLDDIDTQEMLVKNFINYTKVDDVEVSFIEVRTSSSGNRIIKIYLETDDPAANIDSWYGITMCDYMNNKLFPFIVKPTWTPSFDWEGAKIFLDVEIVNEEEDQEEITEKWSEKYKKSKTNLQESIKRILREETKLNPMILRRVRRDDLEREFEESLDSATNSVFHLIRNGGGIMVLDRFKYITVSRLIDGIHYEIYSTTPEDSVWYDEVFNSLKDYYTDRIEVRYKKLMSEI
jgi:hypothetical protein